jgi:hypothetical protein
VTQTAPSLRTTALGAAILATALGGCGGSDAVAGDGRAADDGPYSFSLPAIGAEIPAGWASTGLETSALRDPELLLTAGSFDLSPHGRLARGGSCSPAAAVDLKPDDGALVAVTKYSPGHLSPLALRRLPHRPQHVTLSPRDYGTFECAGESYDLQFREGGVGYKVDVWLDPNRVDPQVRADAIRLIDSLDLHPNMDSPEAPPLRVSARPPAPSASRS